MIPRLFSAGGDFVDLIPVYKDLGKRLVAMHKLAEGKENTIPRPRKERPATTSEEPRGRSVSVEDPPGTSENAAPRSPLEELIRFVNTSALGTDSDLLEQHEAEYNRLLVGAPETYSCFREQNPSYQLITTILDPNGRHYLAQLMMWRTYLWGLDIDFQRRFQSVKSGAQFHKKWVQGTEALKRTACPQYKKNVPFDVDGMTKIWKGALELWNDWKKWRKNNPLTLDYAETTLIDANLPVYTRGPLSRILLYADLVRSGILVPPTAKELAPVIVRAKSIATSIGLVLLRLDNDVETALSTIRDLLNSELPENLRQLFHGGEVGIFDVEHILCKFAKKQGAHATASPHLSTRIALKRKRHSKEPEPKRRSQRRPDSLQSNSV